MIRGVPAREEGGKIVNWYNLGTDITERKQAEEASRRAEKESRTVVTEGDFVILHGRFSDFGLPVNWIVADIVRMKDGILVEHWDVIHDEATRESSKSGRPVVPCSAKSLVGERPEITIRYVQVSS